jgi:hypothetical protein
MNFKDSSLPCSQENSYADQVFLCLSKHHPRLEAGKNTSTVIPASRKRRRKGNRISLR